MFSKFQKSGHFFQSNYSLLVTLAWEDLIEKTGDGSCTVHEFLTGKSDFSVNDDNRDTTFLEELGDDHSEEAAGRDTDDDDDTADQELPTPCVHQPLRRDLHHLKSHD